ncbi:MAG: beta-ketoacyl-[acyl-carrier-protein] synthase family protein [Verrucomicrobiota bacterium]
MRPFSLRELLKENPIVLSGMGVYCAAGTSVDELWRNVAAGASPARWLELPESKSLPRVAACVAPAWHPERPEFRLVRKMDRCVQLALAAALPAWEEARAGGIAAERIAIISGTSRGPINKWNEGMHWLVRDRMLPSLAANSTLACLSGALSQVFHAKGSCLTVASACASAASAIALGARMIATDEADVALVGGADAPLNPLVITQLNAAGLLGHHEDPTRTCRPFDRTRDGLLLGEGAGFLVLESASHAQARGVAVQARLLGWATGADTSGRAGVSEHGDGLVQVMRGALELAGIEAAQIDYVNAHGTGTQVNDAAETHAMQRVFGGRNVPCSSTKPVTGHCMGATPAIEAILCIEAMRHQLLPPTANCKEPDPVCALDVVPGKARAAKVQTVMSNSLGFWGNNAAVILGKAD